MHKAWIEVGYMLLAFGFYIFIVGFLIAIAFLIFRRLGVISSGGPRPWWERKRFLVLLALLIGSITYPVGRHVPKYFYSHSEQDLCEFGTGSTALYDRLRGEADIYLQKHGYAQFRAFTREMKRAFAEEIEAQLNDFAMSRPTATERWAAIHALMRAYGMDFDYKGPQDRRSVLRRVRQNASYFFLLPKFKWNCPVCYVFPEARIGVHIKPQDGDGGDQVRTVIDVGSFNLLAQPVAGRRSYQICPKVLY